MSEYELPESRLATTDAEGNRVYIHPHDLKGKWKNRRQFAYWFLISLYLILPWVYIDGHQVILLDLPAREFYFFGNMFYAHDGPYLIFFLLAFLFFISFVTTLLGRVWCGWACPQTVFIDAIFRRIERFVEGSGAKRDKLERAPWNTEKIFKRSTKWILFILVSLHIVHSGIGYFVGTHELLFITTQNPNSNMTLFLVMMTLTIIILLDFGWFREQFCIIACPYGRFQSLVMDENSLIVAYDRERGEPRKRSVVAEGVPEGDCVNCNRCVNVCPTGIDIRDGLQMECIACTMCIDACDEIMDRVHKPRGLIKYTTEETDSGRKHKISVRVYVYFLLFAITMGIFLSTLSHRKDLKGQVLRVTGTPYQVVNKDTIINSFILKLNYMNKKERNFKIVTSNPKIKVISMDSDYSIMNENKTINVFLQFPQTILSEDKRMIKLQLQDLETSEIFFSKEVQLVGPI